jgi:opacity protein-like surface antigen
MKFVPAAAALAAALLFPAASAADFYGELHAGTTRADNPSITGDERVEGAYGIGVGVKYGEYFSTQLDWHTLGENPYVAPVTCPIPPCPIVITTGPFPEHAFVLRALPRLPLGESFAIELGLGLADWEGDQDVVGTEFTSGGTDWMYSLGVEWRFAERWSATVEMQVYEIESIDFDWAGATLRYRF